MIKKNKLTYISEESEEPKNKIKEFRTKINECQKEKEEYLTQAQRARADLINYRRRQEEKIIPGIVVIGQASIINKILPILDSLEAGAEKNEDVKKIKEQMISVLKECNIEEIKTIGEEFNPEFHEAVEQVKSKKKQGIITQEIQKGYLLNKKLLRVSKVKVAK
ncbi:nucleotide exchange factor GrpE [Patescibacteria group bacterium]|nr:nucleotide exchange factor GrpE [Patescibacteria group bacterium]